MALITNLATLQSAVADHYNKTNDATFQGHCNVWVQLAEQRFQRDPRVREPGSNNAVLSGLDTTNPNWLLTAEPDIYLYGVLVEAAPFYRDYENIAVYEQRLQSAIDALSGSVRLNPARALALTTYAELQTLVADLLQRGDIKTLVPVLIVMAEREFSRDSRVKNLDTATFTIDADDEAVPSGFRYVESWYHDGPTYYGPIEIVPADRLPLIKARLGTSGAPRAAAHLDGVFRFAPVADASYPTKLAYWRTVTALASGVNWLYTSHPDIYLFGAAAQAGPWVRGDARAEASVAEARQELERRLEQLNLHVWNEQWGGDLRRQIDPIG